MLIRHKWISWPIPAAAAVALAGAFAAAQNPNSRQEPRSHLPSVFVEAGQDRFAYSGKVGAELSASGITVADHRFRFRVEHAGADPAAAVEGVDPMETVVNFIAGSDPRQWRTGLRSYGRVRIRGAYPGIDILYGSSTRRMKSDYVVHPGADPRAIRLRYPDAEALWIDEDGALAAATSEGELRESAPEVYQDIGGQRIPVAGRFVILGEREAGFEIGAYDPEHDLVIDPEIVASGYYGGPRGESATAAAVDGQGFIYLAGWTDSPILPLSRTFPFGGSVDGFIAKFEGDGASPVWVTYLGGAGDDRILAMAAAPGNDLWVAGATAPRNFPIANALQATRRGTRDGFLARFSSSGTVLQFSTYLGGSQQDTVTAMRVDSAGAVYLAGETNSPNFPTASPLQRHLGGMRDAFLAKIVGGTIQFSTYLGGSGDDRATAIGLTASAVFIGGCAGSTDFPVKNAFQATRNGAQDGFLAGYALSGPVQTFATLLGGSAGSPECVAGLDTDSAGNVYAVGTTTSANFPVSGAAQPGTGGSQDAFFAKFSATGVRQYSSYLGGRGMDAGAAIAADAAQRVWIAGSTSGGFPTVSPVQPAHGGVYDAFLARVESSGASVSFSTYLGGSANDTAAAVTLAGSKVVVAGSSSSANLPVVNNVLGRYAGSSDAFLTLFAGP